MTCLTPKTAIRVAVTVGDVLCTHPLSLTVVDSAEPDSLDFRIEDRDTGERQDFVLSYRRTAEVFEGVCRSTIALNVYKLRAKSRQNRDVQAEAEWIKTKTA